MSTEPVRDTYAGSLPEGRFDGPAVRELRFGVALRGYAMDQVDTVLDRLASDLEARDARIAQLEAQLGTGGAEPAPDVAETPAAWEQPR